MPKLRLYHVRTLFWAYFVWAVLLLLYAYLLCIAAHKSIINLSWIWIYLHAVPLIYLPDMRRISMSIPVVFAAIFSIVVGLLINKWWANILIVIGVSCWFFLAMCISGLWV